MVATLMANDEHIGWDPSWAPAVEALLWSNQLFTFRNAKLFETFIMNGILPMATIDQPSRLENPVYGEKCFVYAGACAMEVNNVTSTVSLASVLKASESRMGGSAGFAFGQFQQTHRHVSLLSLNHEFEVTGSPHPSVTREACDAIDSGSPLAIGVHWQSTKIRRDKTGRELRPLQGNHWLYAVGRSGNKLHVRDQQNGHCLGTIDMTSWTGMSIDNNFFYLAEKMAIVTLTPRPVGPTGAGGPDTNPGVSSSSSSHQSR